MALPRIFIFIGSPGSGKGTQAEMLARELSGYIHLDTGRAIKSILLDPRLQDDPVIRTQRERMEKGLIVDSEWVMKIVGNEIKKIGNSGNGIIFSGSPRDRAQADMLIPILESLYGEQSIAAFHLLINKEISLFRVTHRRVCAKCATPIQWSEENDALIFCTLCGGELVTRVDDKSEVVVRRISEYERLTETVLPMIVAMGIPVFDINGDKPPDTVHASILKILREKFL
jgi:adenylate kinase